MWIRIFRFVKYQEVCGYVLCRVNKFRIKWGGGYLVFVLLDRGVLGIKRSLKFIQFIK